MGILNWLRGKEMPKADAASHFKQSLDNFETKRQSGAITTDDASSVYEDAVEKQPPFRGEPLRKVDFTSARYGGFDTSSGYDKASSTVGDYVLKQKVYLRDEKTGSAISIDENLLRTRTNYTEKDVAGADRQVQRETKVGSFEKKVGYRVGTEKDGEKETKRLEKEIERGFDSASVTWTKKDGNRFKRDFNGFTLGPLSVRYKKLDGTKHFKIQLGKRLGFERFEDEKQNVSKQIVVGDRSRVSLTKDKKPIEVRTFTPNHTRVESHSDDGSVIKYKQKGIHAEKLSIQEIEKAIDDKQSTIKVRRLLKPGIGSEPDRDFKKSRFTARMSDTQRGLDGKNDVTITRNRLGIKRINDNPGTETVSALKMQETPGAYPQENAARPGKDSPLNAKLMKLQALHRHDRDRGTIRSL